MKRKMIESLLVIFFIGIVQCMISNAVLASDSYYTESDTNDNYNNYSSNNYKAAASPVDTNLIVNSDGTFSKVQVIWNQREYVSRVVVEKYSSNFEYISTKVIPNEFNICAGYYCGEKYNFLVFGQVNSSESDDFEVIRIVKYDKNWNKISYCSLKGINTKIPFDAGSCRMVEKNGILYINTSHQMYKSKNDGLNHQANLFIKINEETMKCTFERSGVSNTGTGYVSHSFNQFIVADDSYIYAVDQGDSYPRGVFIAKYKLESNGLTKLALPFRFSGEMGNNNTGASVGGVELSDSSCIIVGNSVKQNPDSTKESDYYENRNIFMIISDKNDLSSENSTIKWLTSYAPKGSIYCNTPHLVKINNNKFVVLWEEVSNTEINIKAVIVDGSGNYLSKIITIGGRLSACKPIVHNGKIIWCVSNEKKVIFFSLDISDINTFNNYDNKYKIDTNDFAHFEYKFTSTKGEYVLGKFDNKVSSISLPKSKYPWINYELEYDTFNNSTVIQSVTIPEGYTVIPGGCFENAKNLKKITLPSTIKEIRQQAFAYTALESITIPDSVNTIGRAAFFRNARIEKCKIT